jgi:hypothetical protein
MVKNAPVRIKPATSLTKAYTTGAIVMNLHELKFFIDNTSDTLHPCLMLKFPGINPLLFAENISDLQFRYVLKNGAEVDVPALVQDIREVKIGLTGRSQNADPDDDEYRLRTYSTSVNIRNL